MDIEREIRDIKASIADVRTTLVPVSAQRLAKIWKSVRETIDEFSRKLSTYEVNVINQSKRIEGLIEANTKLEEMILRQATQVADLTTIATNLQNEVATMRAIRV